MTKFGLMGAAVLSLALVIGATASNAQPGHHYRRHIHAAPPSVAAYGEPNLPVDQAIRFGYSQGYADYPSGWGGIYGDGRYPGNTVSSGRYNTMH